MARAFAFKAVTLWSLLPVIALLFCADARAESCPVGCRTWFDGCNTRACNSGQVGDCTKTMCDRQEPARCADPPSAAAPSTSSPTRTNEEGCAAYARAAVEQYDKLRALGCNCWNGRWNNNYDVHRNWCLSLPNWNDARPEFDIRQTDLGWCKNGRLARQQKDRLLAE